MIMYNRGFTLFELLISIGIISVVTASTLSNLATLKNPLASGAETTVGFIKQVRAKAGSTTSSYFIFVSGGNKLVTTYAANCAVDEVDRTTDSQMTMTLPTGVSIANPDWTTCFNSRGLAAQGSQFTIQDVGSRTRVIEIFLGGAVRVS